MGRVIRQLARLLDVTTTSPAFNRVLAWSPTLSKFVYRRLRNYEDITDYGALEGTTDTHLAVNTAAVQAAVDAAIAGSRGVYIPNGTFVVGQINVTDGRGMTFRGANRQHAILKASSAGNTILKVTAATSTQSPTGLRIADLGFIGAGKATGPTTACAIHLDNCGIPFQITMERILARDFRRHAIAVGSLTPSSNATGIHSVIENTCWNSAYRDIEIHECGDHGMYLQSAGPTVTIDNFMCFNPATVGSSYTIGSLGAVGNGQAFGLYIGNGVVSATNVNIGDTGTTAGVGGGGVCLGSVRFACRGLNLEQNNGSYFYTRHAVFTLENVSIQLGNKLGTGLKAIDMQGDSVYTSVLINPEFTTGSGAWANGEPVHCVNANPNLLVIGNRTASGGVEGADSCYSGTDGVAIPIANLGVGGYVSGRTWFRVSHLWPGQVLTCPIFDPSADQNFGTSGRRVKQIFVGDHATLLPTHVPSGDALARGDLSLNDWQRMTTANGNIGVVAAWSGSAIVPRRFGAIEGCEMFPVASVTLQARSAAPSSPVNGQIYFDSDDNHYYGWANGSWKQLDN